LPSEAQKSLRDYPGFGAESVEMCRNVPPADAESGKQGGAERVYNSQHPDGS